MVGSWVSLRGRKSGDRVPGTGNSVWPQGTQNSIESQVSARRASCTECLLHPYFKLIKLSEKSAKGILFPSIQRRKLRLRKMDNLLKVVSQP